LKHALGGVGAAVEDDILTGFAQFGLDGFVDDQLPGIDDAHIHAGLDGVIEEHRVHRFTHRFVAAERKAQVGYATGNVDVGQGSGDLSRRFDEIDTVIVVLVDTGGN